MATLPAPQPATPAVEATSPALESAAHRIAAAPIDAAAAEIAAEAAHAMGTFARFNSAHEGYAVILEELDELWDEVKANNLPRALEEAVQVGAMALRFMVDLRAPREGTDSDPASPAANAANWPPPANDPAVERADRASSPGRATWLDPATPLLMADLSWRPIGTLTTTDAPPANPADWPLPADDPAVEHAMTVHRTRSDQQRDDAARTTYRYAYAFQRTRDHRLLIELANSVIGSVVLHGHPDYDRAVTEFEALARDSAGQPPVDGRDPLRDTRPAAAAADDDDADAEAGAAA